MEINLRLFTRTLVASVLAVSSFTQARQITPQQVSAALQKAAIFYHSKVAVGGGYVYAYSADLILREAEGKAGQTLIWVQPPGTPFVGEAFLDAYEATADILHLNAARDAAYALVRGQLHSGGWYYRIELDPANQGEFSYRLDTMLRKTPDPVSRSDRTTAAGWYTWKKRKYKSNMTILDDDTTQAAVRFLVRMDKTLDFKDAKIHDAAQYALRSLLNVQYPNGAWSANYDRFQLRSPDPRKYPLKPASYPESWPARWPKDFRGCYVTNDNLMANMIKTMLTAWRVYKDKRHLDSARKAGRFLALAQMPEPQPAWAQQYDSDMHPVWDRAFEPAAISGYESQNIMDALIQLAHATGDNAYAAGIPRAVVYFRTSLLGNGQIARFYELKTNRPLYFTRDKDGRHVLTYDTKRLATNYGWMFDSRLDEIETKYKNLLRGNKAAASPVPTPAEIERIIAGMDTRGAWVESGRLKHHKIEPPGGIITSATFAENMQKLSAWLLANKPFGQISP